MRTVIKDIPRTSPQVDMQPWKAWGDCSLNVFCRMNYYKCSSMAEWIRMWCTHTHTHFTITPLSRDSHSQLMLRWLDGITNSVDMNLSNLWEIVKDRGVWRAIVLGISKTWTQLNDWTATTMWGLKKKNKQMNITK